MSDSAKGTRVTGFFIFLLGAGVILDSTADWIGALMAAGGGLLLAWGLFRPARHRDALADPAPERS